MSVGSELSYLKRKSGRNKTQDAVIHHRAELAKLMTRLEQLVVPEKLSDAYELSEKLEKFAVQTALIGQVKAGKTALSNALLGINGLLPSDVNPWTSVVTSVHLNQPSPKNKTAIFRFFSREEWDGMVEMGGRIATMAKKANMDTEIDDMRAQIIDMQQRTVKRLGKNFELLLNNKHAFSEFDSDLIRRYVCLGEDGAEQDKEGRFAEMTRSAALYTSCAHFDYPMTVVDTPGVNDPFLVREAVTLDSLGKSDICIIVLSAHQALSTSDLALMRILLNLKQEQIVLFINRVDELPEPASQIVEIHNGIRDTLKRQKLPTGIPVIFGSAIWAEAALAESMDDLPDDSMDVLAELIETVNNGTDEHALAKLIDMEDLSGMSTLQSVLDSKSVEGLCAPFITDLAISASNLALQSRAALSRSIRDDVPVHHHIDIVTIEKKLNSVLKNIETEFSKIRDNAFKDLTYEMSGVFREFLFTESRSLENFLGSRKRVSNWTPDSEGLRRQLNDVYRRVTTDMARKIATHYRAAYKGLSNVYDSIGNQSHTEYGLSRPNCGLPATPISLMRTMSFDMADSWVSAWALRKLRKNTYLTRFQSLVTEQMHVLLSEVQETHVSQYCEGAEKELREFVRKHLNSIRTLSEMDSDEKRKSAMEAYSTGGSIPHRVSQLSGLVEHLEDIVEDLNAVIGEDKRKSA